MSEATRLVNLTPPDQWPGMALESILIDAVDPNPAPLPDEKLMQYQIEALKERTR